MDSGPYADAPTKELIERAKRHRRRREQELGAYQARVFSRVQGQVGRSRFIKGLSVIKYESVARVEWRPPATTVVEVEGAQSKMMKLPGFDERTAEGFWAGIFTTEPWFAPASLGDEIELLGLPEEPAIHPLAQDAQAYYHYAITDSVVLGLPNRQVRTVAVAVEPRVFGPVLVSGEMWLDADSLDVVRMSVTFVGDPELLLGDDDEELSVAAIEAHLEYALHLGRFWLPHYQVVSATLGVNVLPGLVLSATHVSSFSGYRVWTQEEALPELSLDLPDGDYHTSHNDEWNCEPFPDRRERDRCGRETLRRVRRSGDSTWVVVVPPLDSLMNYQFEGDIELEDDGVTAELLEQRITELAERTEAIPVDYRVVPRSVPSWTQSLRKFRFNRVQGASFGLEYVGHPGLAFTEVELKGRFSIGDLRPTGGITWRRDAPGGLLELTGYRAASDLEPWTDGTGLGNSLSALVTGHDDADYYLAWGAGLAFQPTRGALAGTKLSLGWERQFSMELETGSTINDVFFGDGDFQANPAVREGDYLQASVERRTDFDRASWTTGAQLLAGTRAGVRLWTWVQLPFTLGGREVSIGAKAGTLAGTSLPQLQYRLGGPGTVRGFTYGIRRGDSFWAVQAEAALTSGATVAPVIFVDVGDLIGDLPVDQIDLRPMVGAGAGLAFLSGWVRVDLSTGIRPSTDPRLDIIFRVPR